MTCFYRTCPLVELINAFEKLKQNNIGQIALKRLASGWLRQERRVRGAGLQVEQCPGVSGPEVGGGGGEGVLKLSEQPFTRPFEEKSKRVQRKNGQAKNRIKKTTLLI